MHQLATAAEAIAGTTKKTEKVRLLAAYFLSRRVEEAAVSAVFLSGRPFPAWEEATVGLGGTQLWRAVTEISRKGETALAAAYRRHGDLGAAAYDVLRSVAPAEGDLSVLGLESGLRGIAQARSLSAKLRLGTDLLRRATALEAKYIVKIVTGELRIGLKESLVEEAIAKAFDAEPGQVQRANMLLGDIGETLRMAAHGRLEQARMRLFHPLGFMLASPAETSAEALAQFPHAAVEDKYDGIRAQAHVGREAPYGRLFSRTLDDITATFPELAAPLRGFRGDLILDGEIVAWSSDGQQGRALPFSELQKRLGRKRVTEEMMRSVPVAYVVFDVLYAEGELVIERPLRERALILDAAFSTVEHPLVIETLDPQGSLVFEPAVAAERTPLAQVLRAPALRADSPQQLEALFEAAQARGNEGLMVKDLESAYTPGRRGKSWLKLKRELATLDVVVTAVEWGHGKRAGVLSDVTFAVRAGEQLLNVGKAYSGLTDREISELTQWFLEHTIEEQGFRRTVEPKLVLEVAFNAVMRSDRHDSGYALRFPRILRIRGDKSAEDIDTLERVREIYERQKWPATA